MTQAVQSLEANLAQRWMTVQVRRRNLWKALAKVGID